MGFHAHYRILTWALIFILRLRFPPKKSIITIIYVYMLFTKLEVRTWKMLPEVLTVRAVKTEGNISPVLTDYVW